MSTAQGSPSSHSFSSSAASLLVTGAAGFIGARFIESCNQRGIPVISVDAPEHFIQRKEHRGVDFGQIVPRNDLVAWLKKENPKLRAIVHIGACTDTMQYDWDYLERVNLKYSQDLWSYCTETRTPFIYASSGATYGAGENGYDDDETALTKLKPLNPYGQSKHLFDIWALEQEKAGKHPLLWSGFKFFNVYGFGERHKGKMASMILHGFDQIMKTGQVKLFKSHKEGIAHGHQKRDFIYVQDLIQVLFFALEKPIRRGLFNLGTGEARTFLDLIKAVFHSMEKPENIEYIDTPEILREKYQYFTQANMSKLRQEGYTQPFASIESGAADYVARLKKQNPA